ncbi:MAG: AAA family ATPase [Candidatus Aenigmarchaeota archaeon]|nr:AAA family ATPase [Candidatus Aenigmarchaeota archaeon]
MNKAIKRVRSGIPGLDELIEGGFPEGSTVLVSGGPGSGKTILSLQFLVNGALKENERGIYVSLEEDVKRLKDYISKIFKWPLQKLIEEKKLLMVRAEFFDFEKFKNLVETQVERIKAKRLVIDPITVLSLFFERPLEIRRSLLELDRLLKKLGCTTLITCEIPEGHRSISSFGIEEFTSDGIILLYYFSKAYPRAISVRKMRATKHDMGIHPFEIRENGIIVYPTERIFTAE